MAEVANEEAFRSSMQAMNETAGGNSNTGDASGEQIDSSDEYDPAQDVQDDSFPGPSHPDLSKDPSSVATSNNPSRPTSTQPQEQDTVQTDPVKSPTGVLQTSEQEKTTDIVTRPQSIVNSTTEIDSPTALPKARLPQDRIGILEDRIADDEKGDTEAWLSLIEEYKARGKIEDAKQTYERFLKVFPLAADQWVSYANMENEAGHKGAVEEIFQRKLKELSSLAMWTTYLNHIRRFFNLATDKAGNASQVNHMAYEAVLDAVGVDKDSGQLWLDYIQFIKSSPGAVGGTTWQDQQKMDLLRKAYQRAVCVPTQSVETIWKEYSNFEMGLNKLTGRKFLQEKSPDYMSARSSYTELQNITRDLRRTTLPALPPALGFEGDVEYSNQVDIWKRWIHWERSDPLVLKDENPTAYKARIVYAYKQALMASYFWPEMWVDAVDFCFDNDLESEGNEFLSQGTKANPESCLLAFKQADRLEQTTTNGNNDDSKRQRGIKVREPYDTLLDTLYDLVKRAMDKEAKENARLEAEAKQENGNQVNGDTKDDGEDEAQKPPPKPMISLVKSIYSVQIRILNRTISHAWIALMRAMQRMQGKGRPGAEIGGSRQIFADSRKRGRITGDVWIAAALLEFHNTDSESAKRIFERGMKLFPEDETFALEYIKLLTNTNDNTNARVVFERSVDRLLQKPEVSQKAKPLFSFFHRYESQYGELAQVMKLEKRMKEAFPDDPKLSSFSQRYCTDDFDPTAIRPITSISTQARPRLIMPTIEPVVAAPIPEPAPAVAPAPPVVVEPTPAAVQPPPAVSSPPIVNALPVINSPKRPLPLDDFGVDSGPPRKLVRGESPLAGAAGRRLNAAKANRQNYDTPSVTPGAGFSAPPPPLPRDVLFLLSIIPPASTYQQSMIIPPEAVVKLVRDTNLPASASQLPPRPPTGTQFGQGYPMPPAPYPGQMPFSR